MQKKLPDDPKSVASCVCTTAIDHLSVLDTGLMGNFLLVAPLTPRPHPLRDCWKVRQSGEFQEILAKVPAILPKVVGKSITYSRTLAEEAHTTPPTTIHRKSCDLGVRALKLAIPLSLTS